MQTTQSFEQSHADVKRYPTGVDLLHNPALNKGTAFSEAERDAFGLRGLLPPRPISQDQQVTRVLENLRRKPNNIEKYIFLISLQDRNESLFYRVVMDNLEDMMPLIYTPTVGQACQEYGHIFRRPRGLYISADDRDNIANRLRNWPERDVRVVVVTDGERVLGLGDLGVNGAGIPIGKLSLYTACAGVPPSRCLPVVIDVGTNNEGLRNDPLYLGLPRERIRGQAYDELIDEFVTAVATTWPRALIQFEDFAKANALRLLERYRDRFCCFNDDVQGTASVVLAGLHSALRLSGGHLRDQTLLFFGAGGAGIGIGQLVVRAMIEEGLSESEARARCWYFGSKGLLVKNREDLSEFQRPFAHDAAAASSLVTAVERIRPTAIIGVSGAPGSFTQPVVEALAAINRRPIIFALSNPTSCAECTAEQAYRWSGGRAVFASGSPFPSVSIGGQTYSPGQGNNSYIFPAVGLGVVVSGATRVTDAMFLAAAKTLADTVTQADLDVGRIYPSLDRLRAVSANIAVAVAEVAYNSNLTRQPRPQDVLASVKASMFDPRYRSYVN